MRRKTLEKLVVVESSRNLAAAETSKFEPNTLQIPLGQIAEVSFLNSTFVVTFYFRADRFSCRFQLCRKIVMSEGDSKEVADVGDADPDFADSADSPRSASPPSQGQRRKRERERDVSSRDTTDSNPEPLKRTKEAQNPNEHRDQDEDQEHPEGDQSEEKHVAANSSFMGPTLPYDAAFLLQQTLEASSISMRLRLLFDSKEVGAVIGKSGANIREIRGSTGAHIEVSKAAQGVNQRVVTVEGTPVRIYEALKLIVQRLIEHRERAPLAVADHAEGKLGNPNEVNLVLLIPNVQVGLLIGKGGAQIKVTRDESGANIKV